MTLELRRYPEGSTRDQLETSHTASVKLVSLDHLAGNCAPHELAGWASRQGIETYFIDNCWVRVVVTPDELEKFADEFIRTASDREKLLQNRALTDGILVLESEEF